MVWFYPAIYEQIGTSAADRKNKIINGRGKEKYRASYSLKPTEK